MADRRDWDAKVLRTFVTNGQVDRLPAQLKKRLVIYRWVTEQIEPGRRYSESSLNEVLKRYHADVATIRREMVVYGFMDRTRDGIYWRTGPQTVSDL